MKRIHVINEYPKHWIIRIGDGVNFKNSKYPFWGMKKGKDGCIKTFLINHVKEGDILWFCTNKKHGGIAIAMAEYTTFYDRSDEPLIKINTYTNKDQNWIGDEDWSIQMHYKNLYNTEKQTIQVILSGPSPIIEYDKERPNQKNIDDLYKHYKGFKFYGEPKII